MGPRAIAAPHHLPRRRRPAMSLPQPPARGREGNNSCLLRDYSSRLQPHQPTRHKTNAITGTTRSAPTSPPPSPPPLLERLLRRAQPQQPRHRRRASRRQRHACGRGSPGMQGRRGSSGTARGMARPQTTGWRLSWGSHDPRLLSAAPTPIHWSGTYSDAFPGPDQSSPAPTSCCCGLRCRQVDVGAVPLLGWAAALPWAGKAAHHRVA